MQNRLAHSTSPYLLQHADNPVDWREWEPEAFEAARRENKPIFLSIGYATCYWCHVMQRESFESEQTAAIMNEHFVCIKLDREQRPDVDELYMTATQTMTGRGGWPMSVFIEPESLKPFFCGTYFPPTSRHGLPSFAQVLEGMADAWQHKREDVRNQAEAVGEAVLEQIGQSRRPVVLDSETVQEAVGTLLKSADDRHGGFGGAPKFPQPASIDLLLAVREAADEPTRLAIDRVARTTLDQMMIGGINDHLAGGFHRYSVDATWTVPHFEKMLYDNALLASTYNRAAVIYGDSAYAATARATLDWAIREMSIAGGGFASALDAEVDGKEGLNYLWTEKQIRQQLEPDDAAFALSVFDMNEGPNFQDPHHPDEPMRSVLRLAERSETLAGRLGIGAAGFDARYQRVRAQLLSTRAERQQPHRDDKVLAAWNGLMIRALAEFGHTSDDPAYTAAARSAWVFIREHMIEGGPTDSPVLLRSARDGRAQIPAFLEDSASVIAGLVALAQADKKADEPAGDELEAAERLAHAALEDFADPESGALYDTRSEQRDLFVRARSTYDGAMPSGTSMMIRALLDLAEATGNGEYGEAAVRAIVQASHDISRSPVATVHAVESCFRLLRFGVQMDAVFERAGAERARPTGAPPHEPDPVEVYASVDRITLTEGEPAELTLLVRVRDGFHILAAQQPEGVQGLVPLRIGIVGGSGVSAYADYPDGSPLSVEGERHDLAVHDGEVEIIVVLERDGAVTARPILIITYQACTETECHQPRTVEIDVAIDT